MASSSQATDTAGVERSRQLAELAHSQLVSGPSTRPQAREDTADTVGNSMLNAIQQLRAEMTMIKQPSAVTAYAKAFTRYAQL